MRKLSYDELGEKEVININDCRRLGYISDICIDIECGRILSFTVKDCGGFPPKNNEVIIPWENINKIGDDIIFVDICIADIPAPPPDNKGGKKRFFG